jgi:cell wall-associated NlpC family hydrolase
MGQTIKSQQSGFQLEKLSQNIEKAGENKLNYVQDSPYQKSKENVLSNLKNLNQSSSNSLDVNSQAIDGNSGNAIIEAGKQFVGTPYVWGGNDLSKGIDCSGLTQQLFKQQGIELPRVAADQAKGGKDVSFKDLQAGDLVFFNTLSDNNEPVDHVGVYAGGGKFLNAQSNGVMFDDLNSSYWKNNYVKAKRY